mmetsp:Transcript_30017/g.92631  ORF Transcript_30017/g.92631 Transcript_30017/m.92631 type:complete len:223 (-) Transcript_30017:884-1552(-)
MCWSFATVSRHLSSSTPSCVAIALSVWIVWLSSASLRCVHESHILFVPLLPRLHTLSASTALSTCRRTTGDGSGGIFRSSAKPSSTEANHTLTVPSCSPVHTRLFEWSGTMQRTGLLVSLRVTSTSSSLISPSDRVGEASADDASSPSAAAVSTGTISRVRFQTAMEQSAEHVKTYGVASCGPPAPVMVQMPSTASVCAGSTRSTSAVTMLTTTTSPRSVPQ